MVFFYRQIKELTCEELVKRYGKQAIMEGMSPQEVTKALGVSLEETHAIRGEIEKGVMSTIFTPPSRHLLRPLHPLLDLTREEVAAR